MTHILKQQKFVLSSSSTENNFINQNKFKTLILNFLFRNITFTTPKERIRALNRLEITQISNAVNLPISITHQIISKFLVDLLRFKQFLNKTIIAHNRKNRSKKIRIYLHKIYRLAPIFDFKRARQNIDILHLKLDRLFFWPQIMTQVAIVIFATDLNDKKVKKNIIQSNLRILCDCSAYAFHRTRNKIGFVEVKEVKKLR